MSKRKKAFGWFTKLDAGNVPLNNAVFNSGIGVQGTGQAMGEDLDTNQVTVLKKSTPYMLRNDGAVFECKSYHPYICNIYNNKDDLESLVNERIDEVRWFLNHTNNESTKSYIKILIKSSVTLGLNYLTTTDKLAHDFDISESTYACSDLNELISILEWLSGEVNQEFCRFRTSNLKFGGDSGDIYFRISSIGFNWFDFIQDIVESNKDLLTTITICRDNAARDCSQGECYSINGKLIDHLPVNEFINLPGKPLIETFTCKFSGLTDAYKRLQERSTLDDAYPKQHPRNLISMYKQQIQESIPFDLKYVLIKSRSQIKEEWDLNNEEYADDNGLFTLEELNSDTFMDDVQEDCNIWSALDKID